jgi:hypothetical protein
MKTKILASGLMAAVLCCGAGLQARTVLLTADASVPANQHETVAFRDSAEAGMMHRAYHILATGDHDYKGHRVAAMHRIEAAAKLLGLDLSGDLKDKEPQVLSDDKLREVKGLLQNVLGASAVKGQKRIERHINGAIDEINLALSVR